MRRFLLIGASVLAGLLALGALGAVTEARESANPFTPLDRAAEPLRSSFNTDAGKVRVLLYVSPTCGGCLRAAKAIQEQLLDEVNDPNLTVYVVWAPRNGARQSHVDRVTDLVTDTRATHYWDEYGAVADPYDEMLDLTGPCAGIFAIYGTDVQWGDGSVPTPEYTEDAHADEFDRAGPQFDGERFADRVTATLSASSE